MKALGYVSLILVLASFVFLHLTLKKIVKNEQQTVLSKDELFRLGGAIGAASLFSLLTMLGLILAKGWTLTGGQYAMSLIGSFFFGLGLSVLYATFGLNFYKPTLDKKIIKLVRIFMYVSIPAIIVFLALASEGVAAHLVYPLANRISLTDGFVDPFNHTARFAVAFMEF